MKINFLLLLFIKTGFSLKLNFNDSVTKIINESSGHLYSCFGIRQENPTIEDVFPLCFQTSCVLIKNFETKTVNGFCDEYMIYSVQGTIAHQTICPLKGQINKINLFVNKNFSNNINFNKMYLFIDGCSFLSENGTRTNISWILSDHLVITPSSIHTMNGDENLYEKITSDEVYFDDFNQDCSELCQPYMMESNKVEVFIPIKTAELDLQTFYYFIFGVVLVIVLFFGFYCLNKKFM